MNQQLTMIAALPTTAGSGSALIPERNPSRPRFELTPDDMAAAGYPVAGPSVVGRWLYWAADRNPDPVVHVTIDAADVASPSQLRGILAEAAARTSESGDSTGIYSYEAGGLVRIGDAPQTPSDRQGFEPAEYAERN